jgi:hypothetical protein
MEGLVVAIRYTCLQEHVSPTMSGKEVQCSFRFAQVVQNPIAMNQVELTIDRECWPVQVQGPNVAPRITLAEVGEIP